MRDLRACAMPDDRSTPKAAPPQELAGIQHLRAVAVTLVVLDHLEGYFGLKKYFGVYFSNEMLLGGAIGVDLFFVISGFIIYHITNGLDETRISVADFAAKRFSRIVPFMWTCIVAHYVLRSAGRGNVDPLPYVRALFLFPLGDLTPNQIWTLRHEALFYLLVGLSLLARPWRGVLLIYLLMPLLLTFDAKPEDGSGFRQLMQFVLYPRANLGFAAGVASGWLFHRSRRPVVGRFVGTAVVAVSPLLLLGWPPLLDHFGLHAGARMAATPVLCAFIVYCSLFVDAPRSRFAALSLAVGNASYVIYLTHDVFISAFAGIASGYAYWWTIYASALLTFAAIVLVGLVLHETVEKRIVARSRQFLKALGSRRKQETSGKTPPA